MSDRTDALVQTLFNKPSLEACSLQQVDYLAHQYPYFCTAQLLLLQKTNNNPEAYAYQLQRTALHFSNPLQIRYWLDPEIFETELPRTELFETPMLQTPAVNENMDIQEEELTKAESKEIIDEERTEQEVTPVEKPQSIIEPASPPLLENKMQTEAASITFEPYHTVDYFASQGIKLSQQEATNDALGKQVKSFTDWLKTMKRLPEKPALQQGDAAGERKVENLAAHSLDPAEVVTESMAEVWLKQGNKEKATEVYRKLSLHYPSKSAYFAAKIELLKKS